jgi:YcxB-like protein
MSYSQSEVVQLTFSHTEKEYLAAVRLCFWKSRERLARLVVFYALVSAGLLLLTLVLNVAFPLWATVALILLLGFAMFHAYMIDLPRRYFRSNPKFREEYNLTFTDAGMRFKTREMDSSLAWSFYSGVIENEKFYLLTYGKDLWSVSIVPKRAFRDRNQELTFRELLRRHLDPKLKLSDGEREGHEYVPKSLEPPDWR